MAKKQAARSTKAKQPESVSPADDAPDTGVDFDETLGEIEQIVAQLENGDLSLTSSLEQYEVAVGKLKKCHGLLHSAERRISLLSGFDADGNPVTAPLYGESADSLVEKQAARSGRRGAKAASTAKTKDLNSPDSSADRAADTGSSVDDTPGLF